MSLPPVLVVWARSTAADAVAAVLDDAERARLAALRRPTDVDDRASAHALLRLVVGRELDLDPASLVLTATCRRCGGPHGRPELAGAPGLGLSLSHAPGLVAVAVGPGAGVGVDVELVSATGFEGFARIALAPGERAGTPGQRATTWVRKEALLKATGHGLAVEPRTVVLSGPDEPPGLLAWTGPDDPGPVRLHDLAVGDDHAGAVAVLGAAERVVRVQQHHW